MISPRTSVVPNEDRVFPRLLYSDSRWSKLVAGTPCLVVSARSLVAGAPSLVISAPRCSQTCCQRSDSCHRRSQVLPGAPEGHCIGPVISGIWPLWDSGSDNSQTLPETPSDSITFCWCARWLLAAGSWEYSASHAAQTSFQCLKLPSP